MNFKQQKAKQLVKTDKSNIGKWDSKIKGLCEKLNKKKEYYTTSSCGGRIVLLKASNEKKPDAFLFRSHKKIGFNELGRVLSAVKYDGLVEFKMNSCILHVACKSLEDAQELVDRAKFAGWKRSGIMATGKRFVVELISTENIEFLIMNKRQVLVDDDFLKLIVKEANKRLGRVWEKIGRLERALTFK